jgi:hypothetical protein
MKLAQLNSNMEIIIDEYLKYYTVNNSIVR